MTNDWVHSTVYFLLGLQEPLLASVKRRKLAWLGHVVLHDTLSQTILQGTLGGGQRLVRQRKCWTENVKEWNPYMPKLLTMPPPPFPGTNDWKRIPVAMTRTVEKN